MTTYDDRLDRTVSRYDGARFRCRACGTLYHTKNLGGFLGARTIFTEPFGRLGCECPMEELDLVRGGTIEIDCEE